MKNLLTILALLLFVFSMQAQTKHIKGKLSHMEVPLVNAEVTVQNTDTKVVSDMDGSYEIEAEIGDVIMFSYPGLDDVEIIVEDVTATLNIGLVQNVTELDEVVVKGSNRKSEQELELEYAYNDNLIRTAWGILDKESANGTMRFLKKEDINAVNLCILDVLRSQISGVKVTGDCQTGGVVTIRGNSSISFNTTAVFDVDGQIFTDAPIWLLPSVMERVAVLSSHSLTARYGSIGAGGVVVINTNVGSHHLLTNNLDRARLRNNVYQNDALSNTAATNSLPEYLKALKAAENIAVAKEIYAKNQNTYRGSVHYYIDSYAYFAEKGESKFANEIVENQMALFEDHPVYAKALAYHLEANGELELAKTMYEKAFILRPSYAQSYRDLAESYRSVGNYSKAASIYARYNYLVNEGFIGTDSVGISPIIERESENLLALKGNQIMDGGKTQNRSAKFTEFDGTRLLFEWNDSEAEFDLQFVNPEKHYYTWKHSAEVNPERIKHEKQAGYSCEEFLVDGSLPGRWEVNLDYKGNKKLEPSYLKVTTYYNYGKPSQRKEVNVYRLGLKNVNKKLFGLNNSGMVSAN